MMDRDFERLTGERVNRAAQRRAAARERAELIAALGMAPEDPADPYAATTGELARWAREGR